MEGTDVFAEDPSAKRSSLPNKSEAFFGWPPVSRSAIGGRSGEVGDEVSSKLMLADKAAVRRALRLGGRLRVITLARSCNTAHSMNTVNRVILAQLRIVIQ